MLHLDEHGEGKPRRAVDDDAAEDDSADEHPIAAADRPEDNDDSEGERRSSDDWSTLSEELSEETREGRPDADPRERPVDLGSVEREEDTREWQQLTTDGGVRKRVAQAGSGPHPNDHFTVDVKWVLLRAHDGSLVDVSVNEMWPNKEHKFVLSRNEVMPGLEVAVKSMQRHEVARFWIRSDYAFGDAGCWPKIAPGTTWLVLDAQLMALCRPMTHKLYVRDNNILPYVLKRKEQGNAFYKAGEYRKALHEYKSSIKVIEGVQDDLYKPALGPLALQLLGNLTAAHLALGNWRRVIKYSDALLRHEPTNERALFRRAQALRRFPDRLEDALKDLNEAIRVAPSNRQLRDEHRSLVAEIKDKRQADKQAYGSFLKQGADIYQAERVRVFLEFAQGKKLLGRVEIELFNDLVPKSAENFSALCTGYPEDSKRLHYQGTPMHRVVEGFIVQGGDVSGAGGKGGESIYGPRFKDESLAGKMGRAGVVAMANSGPDTNGSQFFITLAPCPTLEGKHVVVGRVVAGRAVLQKLESVDVDANDAPVTRVVIFRTGVCKGKDRMVDSSSDEE